MKRMLLSAMVLAAGIGLSCRAGAADATGGFPGYRLLKTIAVPGVNTGWDYPAYDAASGQLFVGHRLDSVEVFDTRHGFTMRKVAETLNTNDIALIPQFGLGVAAANTGVLTVFKLKSLAVVKQMKVGKELDSSVYDPVTRRLVPVNTNKTADGKGQRLTVYGVPSFKPVGSVVVPSGDVEHSVADGHGHIFFAAQDVNRILELDMKSLKVVASFPTPGCTQPTGLDDDAVHDRLFVACRGHLTDPSFLVMDGKTGKVLFTAPISQGNDGVAYDRRNGNIFLTDGIGANMFIFHQDGADTYHLAEILDTSTNERTLALDVAGNHVFTIAAEGMVDPAHKILTFVSPFYPNEFTPGSFKVREYGQ